ncbi:MAG: N-acetyl-gamma-glutamyl-phosphate reductase [Chloroflexi bacterium]|nr:N-acetyl-gamma-glutamyl-phosphate reductase [Chloroflexota bacterium]
MELARLLYRHPEVELTCVTGRSAVGQKLGDFLPHLGDIDLTITEDLTEAVDFVFSGLPQVASALALTPVIRQGIKAVDISADFRLKDPAEYQQWYGAEHPSPDLLPQAVYGLTEWYRPQIAECSLLANPGCYPTSALLALGPALKEGLIGEDIIIDSKSGVSGAGRGLGLMYHYAEANENVSAYGLGGHRHLPEITQEIKAYVPGFQPRVTFIPHLVPMTRGILSTCYAPLKDGALPSGKAGEEALRELYRASYKGEPFVRVMSQPPQTKQTLANNYCLVYPVIDHRTNRLVVVSVLDNLVKGAAGQAIQNMNLMAGFEEGTGVDALAAYP